ncbi:hypothetical protein EDB80DRAFT_685276 [Ilyonectria destructans]|nr:hypothetical protein EDB80DRAFT_685276 [Ilyonectria destructans]
MEGMKANGEMAGMETRQGHGVGSAGGGWSLGESPRERKMGVGAAAGVAQAMCEGEEAWIERGAGPWATMGWTINGAPRVLWGAFDWGAWDGLTTVAQRDEVHEAGRADTRPFVARYRGRRVDEPTQRNGEKDAGMNRSPFLTPSRFTGGELAARRCRRCPLLLVTRSGTGTGTDRAGSDTHSDPTTIGSPTLHQAQRRTQCGGRAESHGGRGNCADEHCRRGSAYQGA